MVTQIEKKELGPNVVHWNRRYPGQYTKIAAKVSKETGTKIDRHQVTKWLKNNSVSIKGQEVAKDEAQSMLAEDRNKMLEYYQVMLADGLKNYKAIRDDPKKTPEEKLKAIDTVMGAVLNRGLDGVGYGKPGMQVNIQNNIILTETLDRVVEVLNRRLNGSAGEIITELESSCNVHNE